MISQWMDGLIKYKDEFDLEDQMTIDTIPEDKIKDIKNISIKEWHPFLALTETMMGTIDDPSKGGIDTVGDVIAFISSWMGNLTEITQLRVITSEDGKIVIEYGTPIELNYSGKHVSLNSILVDRYYNYSPSIIFTSSDKADQCIREWFGLNGEGKYSMDFDFGKVYIGEFGYRLVFIDGELYQVPIINEDTIMNVYYTENGETTLVMDAADILRNVKIKVSEEEAEKVINRLKETGIMD